MTSVRFKTGRTVRWTLKESWYRNCEKVVINHFKRDASKVEPNIDDFENIDDPEDGMIHFKSAEPEEFIPQPQADFYAEITDGVRWDQIPAKHLTEIEGYLAGSLVISEPVGV